MDIQDPLKPFPLVPPGQTLEQALADPQRQDQIAMGQRFMQQAGPPPSLLTSLGVPDKLNDALARSNIANFGPGMVRSAVSGFTAPGDALAGRYDPMTDLSRIGDMAGMVTLGAGAMPAAEGELGMGIRAYHGSPHDFDAFDMSKIGTGEGAQAYGHGLYFAENPKVAEEYKKRLTVARAQTDSTSGEAAAQRALDLHNGDATKARAELTSNLKAVQAYPDQVKKYEDAIRFVDEGRNFGGRQYEVSINADPEHFLDWDKPLSEQPKAVQEAVHKQMGANGFEPDEIAHVGDMTGERALKFMQEYIAPAGTPGKDEMVTGALRAAGIKGIRYADQGSRIQPPIPTQVPNRPPASGMMWKTNDGEMFPSQEAANAHHKALMDKGTSNYVVFDDKIIDILKKYGIAGLTGGGLAAALAAKVGLVTPPQDAAPAPQQWPAILGVRG